MTVTGFLYTLASVPMFASRPFLAALTTACFARFGPSVPWLRESEVIQALGAAPEWFRSGGSLAALAALAALEHWSARSAEVRDWFEHVDGTIKAAVAVLVSFALVGSDDARLADAIRGANVFGAGAWSALVGGATWTLAAARRALLEHVLEVDADDDVGLWSALGWAESASTFLGLWFLVLFPVAALVLSAATAVGIFVARRRAERREEEARVGCASCGARILPHATRCFACRADVAAPLAVGVFGQPRPRPAPDRALQRLELVSRKRCPDCATRLRRRAVRQACPACRRTTFASREELERYLDAIAARLPRTLAICAALGAVPLLGVVPAVLYYRLNLVAGLRGYIPPLRGCTTRFVVRAIHFGVIALQPIPLVGALVLPAMAWTTYAIYRRSLVGRAEDDLAPAALARG
jgi:hypothetical protein